MVGLPHVNRFTKGMWMYVTVSQLGSNLDSHLKCGLKFSPVSEMLEV